MIDPRRTSPLPLLVLLLSLVAPGAARARTVVLLPRGGSVVEEKGGLILGYCDDLAKTAISVSLNGKARAVELWDGVFTLDLDWTQGENVLLVGDERVTFVCDPYAAKPKAPSVHQAAADNCGNCHVLGPNRSLTLRAEANTLCLGCHRKTLGSFTHGDAACTTCHEPHTSWEPRLLKTQDNGSCLTCHAKRIAEKDPAHGALWDRILCRTCHQPHRPSPGDEGKVCAACHKGIAVSTPGHQATVRGACNACHWMHGAKDRGHRKPPAEACTGCHPPKNDKEHEKAVADCGACHAIHRPVDKGNQEAACRPCHEPVFAKKRLHGPESVGDCAVCHPVHDVRNLSPAVFSCTQCHGPEKLEGGHTGTVVAFNTCSLCHRLHASEEPGFLPKAQHSVFLERRCVDCHGKPQFGRDRKLRGPWAPLCFSCHEDSRAAMTHGPAAKGQCQDCHDPHGSSWENQLTKGPKELCLSCHEAVGKTLTGPHARLGCSECHDPHGGAEDHHLAKPLTVLCTTCHPDPTLDLGGVAKTSIHGPLNAGGCGLCHEAHGGPGGKTLRMPQGELCQSCHEVYAPKELKKLGAQVHAPVARGDCAGCHEPHASRGKALLKDTGNALCRRCHDPKRHSHALAPRGTSGFATVPPEWPRDGGQFACTSCHRPHTSPTPRLFVQDRAVLCEMCHKGL